MFLNSHIAGTTIATTASQLSGKRLTALSRHSLKVVVTCAIYCMQSAAIVACNNCRLSNVFENIHEAKVLQPMAAFGGIT